MYVDAISKWVGTGTPNDPLYPKPPSPYTFNDIESWKILTTDPLYVRFYIKTATTPVPPPPPPPPAPPPASGTLIYDKDVALDAGIQELKIQFSPLKGHRHDGTTYGGAKISYRSLRDIPKILKDLEAGTVVPGGSGGGITGPYVSSVNGATGDVWLDFAAGEIGTPTDGDFAGAVGLASGDKVADAFDKVDSLLIKLMPQRPVGLGVLSLLAPGTYSAREAGTGILRSGVLDALNPRVAAASAFGDGEAGTLTARIDGTSVGSRLLSSADDTGTWGMLRILTDADPYLGQFGKQGFYRQLTADFTAPGALSTGGSGHAYELVHTLTGTASARFYLDQPLPTALTFLTATFAGSGASRYVSGVPSLAAGDVLRLSFKVASAVSDYYHPTRLAAVTSLFAASVDAPLPTTPPAKGDELTISALPLSLNGGLYTENLRVTLHGYNAKGTETTRDVDLSMRLDAKSDERTRVKSGQGGAPQRGSAAGQFGDPFDPVELLTAPGNEELQVLGGVVKYPSLVNYATNLPFGGPDYTAVQPGSYQNMRWYTVTLGEVTDITGLAFDLSGTLNFGASPLVANVAMQVRVDGPQGTGWLNANAAYPGVGNPAQNGEAALVYNVSTATHRVVTFGTAVRTGTLYVRIGLPAGSTKSFTGITRV